MSVIAGGVAPVIPQQWLFNDWPGYRAGQWYGPAHSAAIGTIAVVGGAGGAANSPVYACPVFIFAPVSVDQLGICVGTAVAAVTGKLALAAHDPVAVAPGALIEACAGTVGMNALAGTWNTLPLAAPRTLQRGWHWLLSMFDGVAQPVTLQAGAVGYGGMAPLFGQANGAGLVRNSAATQTTRVQSANQDYTVGFPALFGTPTFGTSTPGMPLMGYRVTP